MVSRSTTAKKPVDAARPARKPRKAQAPRPLDQAVLEGLVGYNLRRAEVRMRQLVIKAWSDWDLRPPEYSALALIATNDLVTQADLGSALNIKRPNMVSLTEKLERRGLIKRAVHEDDRRNHILTLTPKGEALLADTDGLLRDLDLAVTGCWTDRERMHMIALLRRFYTANGDTVHGAVTQALTRPIS